MIRVEELLHVERIWLFRDRKGILLVVSTAKSVLRLSRPNRYHRRYLPSSAQPMRPNLFSAGLLLKRVSDLETIAFIRMRVSLIVFSFLGRCFLRFPNKYSPALADFFREFSNSCNVYKSNAGNGKHEMENDLSAS